MEKQVNLEENKIFHLEDSIVMYGSIIQKQQKI